MKFVNPIIYGSRISHPRKKAITELGYKKKMHLIVIVSLLSSCKDIFGLAFFRPAFLYKKFSTCDAKLRLSIVIVIELSIVIPNNYSSVLLSISNSPILISFL